MEVSIKNSQYIVYLNDKLIYSFISANEEEGWVEIPDIAAMAPLNLNEEANQDITLPEQWNFIPTKRLYGKVKIKSLLPPS